MQMESAKLTIIKRLLNAKDNENEETAIFENKEKERLQIKMIEKFLKKIFL